jgi:hypothetical protein
MTTFEVSWYLGRSWISTYSLCNIIDNDGAVRIPVVHRSKGLVPLLARRVPDLKLDCRVLVQGDGLCEESSADRGFSIRVELILAKSAAVFQTSLRFGIP